MIYKMRIYKVLPPEIPGGAETLEPTDEIIDAPVLEDGSVDLSAVNARLDELNANGYAYCAGVDSAVD